MLKPKKRWKTTEASTEEIDRIVNKHKVHSITASLLINRGITKDDDIVKFLKMDQADFHNPFLLDGMKEAVDRIHLAILKKEKILIYGDYDADGVTSTTIMYKTLKKLEANFAYYIPNRFTEGYGLNKDAIIQASKQGFSVIITVDTGISAVDEAILAKDLDICLIITDHHEAPEVLPEAFTIINPKKPGDSYPFKGLAGVGVAFKLAHALLGSIPEDLLDIVAVGTIADLVPLIDENRMIVTKGLKSMSNTSNLGLRTLLETANLLDKELSVGHIGFIIAPRINASGRLDTASNSVKLFITEDLTEAKKLTALLNEINQERQAQVEKITEEALELIKLRNMDNDRVIVLEAEDWNIGVIGIVASRIVEQFYRPTIILSVDPETNQAKGSARSIEGFDIYQALTTTKDILPHFGGHPAAAGLSIEKSDILTLRTRLNKLAQAWLTDDDFVPIEKVEAVCTLNEINLDLVKELEGMAPFGIGNPNPRLLITDSEISDVIALGKEKQHLKLMLKNDKSLVEALLFKNGDLQKDISRHANIKLVGELSRNEWQGKVKPQIIIKDLHISELQVFDWRGYNLDFCYEQINFEKTAFIFQEKIDIIEKSGRNFTFIYYENWNNNNNEDIRNLVLVHLPQSIEELQSILKGLPQLERVYCLFNYSGVRDLNPYINREYYKQVYKVIMQNGSQITKEQLKTNFNNTKISLENVHFMLDVFAELGFIILDGENIIINHNAEKKELNESKLYNKYLAHDEIINTFLNSNHQMLRKWFIENINDLSI